MAQLTGNTLFVGFWSLMDAVFAVDDPTFVVAGAMTGIGELLFTFLILPPLFVALSRRGRGTAAAGLVCAATGLLTAVIPWILRGSARVASPAELHVGFVLGAHGRGRRVVLLDGGRPQRRSSRPAPPLGAQVWSVNGTRAPAIPSAPKPPGS